MYLWQAQFSALTHLRQSFEAVLSADERERAARYLSEAVRTRFVIARGVMRHVLGYHTRLSPRSLTFVYGAQGKPSLPQSNIHFNLSHSADLLLLGVTVGHPLGVDVEHIHFIPEMTTIAQDHFSLNEQQALFALPPDAQQRAFFTCWTRKEAYIKATGDGFSLPLRDFDVTLAPDEPPQMSRAEGDDPARWRFLHLEPMPGYVGAVCVLGHDFNMTHHVFDERSL